MAREITATIPAWINVQVEVTDDATPEQIAAAVTEECPKYRDLKAGEHFDPSDFTVLSDSAEPETPSTPEAADGSGAAAETDAATGAAEDTFLHVLLITTRHGNDVTLHRSATGAQTALAAFVDQWWPTEMQTPDADSDTDVLPRPADDAEAVNAYFERMNDHGEFYAIQTTIVRD